MMHQQSKRQDPIIALAALAALSCPTRAQDPLACLPSDQRPLCLAYPDPQHALNTSVGVIVIPGVDNNGPSRVAAARGYANLRGAPLYGLLNDTDPLVIWERGAIAKGARELGGRFGPVGTLLTKPLEGVARVLDKASETVGIDRVTVPFSGVVADATHAVRGITHAELGAASEVATRQLANLIVDTIKTGNSLEIVAHSQGGIIAANALVLARNNPAFVHLTDDEWSTAARNLSVVCFGTPQRVFNIGNVVSFVHAKDPLIGAVDTLRGFEPAKQVASEIQQSLRKVLPLLHGPEHKPVRINLDGEFSDKHEFEYYQKNLPRFYAEYIRLKSAGKGEAAADQIVAIGENNQISRQTLEEITLNVFGKVAEGGTTEFQGRFASRMVQYWKEGRSFLKNWNTTTLEHLYHNQAPVYHWEKPSPLIPSADRDVAALRKALVTPRGAKTPTASEATQNSDDTSAIDARRGGSVAIAVAARAQAQQAEFETRQRNDARARAGQTGYVPPEPSAAHQGAVAGNQAAFSDAANRPSELTDGRSQAFAAGLAEQRRRVEIAASDANSEARRANEKKAAESREEAEKAKEKADRDGEMAKGQEATNQQKALADAKAQQQGERIEKRLDHIEESTKRAEQQAAAAAAAAKKAANRPNPKPTIINNYYHRIQQFWNYLYPESSPAPMGPEGEQRTIIPPP